jgi:hypothetical protein
VSIIRKSRSEGICRKGKVRQLRRSAQAPSRRLRTHVLGEHVGDEPGDGLSLHLGLKVDALDGKEDLAEGLGAHHVELPLSGEASAVGDDGSGDRGGSGKGSEEDDEREGIVEIAKRVGALTRLPQVARDAPLLDDVVNPVDGLGLLQVLGEAPLSPADGLGELLCESLVLAELAEDGLVEEVLDVLGVVKGSRRRGSLVGLLAVARFTRVDTWLERSESRKSQ